MAMLRFLLQRQDVPDLAIADLVCDSRRVTPGCAFLAMRGSVTDGHVYAREASDMGAAVIIAERPATTLEKTLSAAWIEESGLRPRVGSIAARFFGDPAKELKIGGVTGTNGKTSVAFLASVAAPSTAYMGTIGWGLPDTLTESPLTTVDPVELHRRLECLRRRGVSRVAMEVSSHALDQRRTESLQMSVAVFTNLTRDHLDYHGSMDAYKRAKFRMFQADSLCTAIINVDDPAGNELASECLSHVQRVIRFGADKRSEVRFTQVETHSEGTNVRLGTPWGSFDLSLGAGGMMCAYNAAAALALAVSLGADPSDAVARLQLAPQIPGRLERVPSSPIAPLVFVDYAHTPDALARTLDAVHAHTSGKVACVFGCGGDRDRGKRALMGRAAAKGSDFAVVTTDNPRSEDPQQIVEDILAGFAPADRVRIETCRDRAIRYAIEQAGSEDAVLIAGKGHESHQAIGGTRLPFSDREAAMRALGGER